MQFRSGVVIAALLASAYSQDAFGQMGMYGTQATSPAMQGMPASHMTPKERALLKLRHEAIDLNNADGGTLTDAHRAAIQQKLDAIQAEYPEPASAQAQQSPPPAPPAQPQQSPPPAPGG